MWIQVVALVVVGLQCRPIRVREDVVELVGKSFIEWEAGVWQARVYFWVSGGC